MNKWLLLPTYIGQKKNILRKSDNTYCCISTYFKLISMSSSVVKIILNNITNIIIKNKCTSFHVLIDNTSLELNLILINQSYYL